MDGLKPQLVMIPLYMTDLSIIRLNCNIYKSKKTVVAILTILRIDPAKSERYFKIKSLCVVCVLSLVYVIIQGPTFISGPSDWLV